MNDLRCVIGFVIRPKRVERSQEDATIIVRNGRIVHQIKVRRVMREKIAAISFRQPVTCERMTSKARGFLIILTHWDL